MRKKSFLTMPLTLSFAMGFSIGNAAIEELRTTVGGLVCPTCSFALEKQMKKIEPIKIEGIDIKTGNVRVSLRKKMLKPNDLRQVLSDLKESTKKAGFKFEEKIRVRVQGTVEFEAAKNEFRLRLNKTHTMIMHKISNSHKKLLRDMMQQRVEVEGELHEHKNLPFSVSVDKVKKVTG